MSYTQVKCPRGHRFGAYISYRGQRIVCNECANDNAGRYAQSTQPQGFNSPSVYDQGLTPDPSFNASPDSFSSGDGGDYGGGGASGGWDSGSSDSGSSSSSDSGPSSSD